MKELVIKINLKHVIIWIFQIKVSTSICRTLRKDRLAFSVTALGFKRATWAQWGTQLGSHWSWGWKISQRKETGGFLSGKLVLAEIHTSVRNKNSQAACPGLSCWGDENKSCRDDGEEVRKAPKGIPASRFGEEAARGSCHSLDKGAVLKLLKEVMKDDKCYMKRICTGAELLHTEAGAAGVQTKGSRLLQITWIRASTFTDVHDDNQTKYQGWDGHISQGKNVQKLSNFHSN